jgi:hypothetical protein
MSISATVGASPWLVMASPDAAEDFLLPAGEVLDVVVGHASSRNLVRVWRKLIV